VFSYLKRYARDNKLDSPSSAKIRLYTYQFYPCFDPYVQFKNGELVIMHQASHINHPKKLVELYRKFYRAKGTKGKPTPANAILKPVDEAAAVILKAELCKTQTDALIDYVAARLCALMNRVHSSTAEGRWVFKNSERDQEREAVLDFSRYFVENIFRDTFNNDRARLAGRQLNLIRDTCEFLYRLEDDKEWKLKKAQSLITTDSSEDESEED
jgi:CRISPR-associated protein Csc3